MTKQSAAKLGLSSRRLKKPSNAQAIGTMLLLFIDRGHLVGSGKRPKPLWSNHGDWSYQSGFDLDVRVAPTSRAPELTA